MKWIIVLCSVLCHALTVNGDDSKHEATMHWWISDAASATKACGEDNNWMKELHGWVTVHAPPPPPPTSSSSSSSSSPLPDKQTHRRVVSFGPLCWLSGDPKKCRAVMGGASPAESFEVGKTNSTDVIDDNNSNNSTKTVTISGGGERRRRRRRRRRGLGSGSNAFSLECAAVTRHAHDAVQGASFGTVSCREYILDHASEWECRPQE
jgi:hypothetical protein